MSEVSEIQAEIDQFMELADSIPLISKGGVATALMRKVQALLSSHAVIDEDSATFLEQSYQEDAQVFGSEGADIEGWNNVKSEIERLSTHKGK